MYKYEYENVSCDVDGIGPINGRLFVMDDHKQVIEERANNGWRYVGFIPQKQRGTGHIQAIDLIFEKKIKENE